MRFALIFVMAVLVVTSTHQYFHDQPMMQMPWLSPYSPHPFINKYQRPLVVYYPRSNPPTLYQSNDVSLVVNRQRNDNSFYVRDTDEEQNHFAEVQSRGKASVLPDEIVAPRFFFGLSSTVTNPFFKTATFTVSSTVTATSVVRCIAAAEFLNAAAQATPCRRKRELLEPLETPESHQLDITPSVPQVLMPTAISFGELMRDNLQSTVNQEIVSSKDETVDNFNGVSALLRPVARDLKEKRFLFGYNANVFVASKTVTSFSFASKTTTLTVDVIDNAGNALLRCLPYGYSVC